MSVTRGARIGVLVGAALVAICLLSYAPVGLPGWTPGSALGADDQQERREREERERREQEERAILERARNAEEQPPPSRKPFAVRATPAGFLRFKPATGEAWLNMSGNDWSNIREDDKPLAGDYDVVSAQNSTYRIDLNTGKTWRLTFTGHAEDPCVWMALGETKPDIVKAQLKVIDAAVKAYKESEGHFPNNIDQLADAGKNYVPLKPEALLDPWKKLYRYDPDGRKNKGEKPDVWSESSEKVIGNWPEDKK